jgi:hypothetical protein
VGRGDSVLEEGGTTSATRVTSTSISHDRRLPKRRLNRGQSAFSDATGAVETKEERTDGRMVAVTHSASQC